jgi:superfamily II DNA/RNA helicase
MTTSTKVGDFTMIGAGLRGDKDWDEFIKEPEVPKANAVLRAIFDLDYTRPSPVQCLAVPNLKAPGASLLAQAPSGSGKTIAYLTAVLAVVDLEVKKTQALVLTTSRELVNQAYDEFAGWEVRKRDGSGQEVRKRVIGLNEYVGLSVGKYGKYMAPRAKPETQVVFAMTGATMTDGRVRQDIDLSALRIVIFDEADAQLDRTANEHLSLKTLIHALDAKTRVGFFSASFQDADRQLAWELRPNLVQLVRKELPATILHYYVMVCEEGVKGPGDGREAEAEALLELMRVVTVQQTVIFAPTRALVSKWRTRLGQEGIDCHMLTGSGTQATKGPVMTAAERDDVMRQFKAENFKVLIAAEFAKRGLDCPQVSLVGLLGVFMVWESGRPTRPDAVSYQHMSGRAGRFGRKGVCLSMIRGAKEEQDLMGIARELGITIKRLDRKCFGTIEAEQK